MSESNAMTLQQLSSLIQLVTAELNDSGRKPSAASPEWLSSPARHKQSLVMYLCRLVVQGEEIGEHSKNEVRLSMILLALICRFGMKSFSEESLKRQILNDLSSVEGFWNTVRAHFNKTNTSVSGRAVSLSLLLHAFKLNDNSDRWPCLLFGHEILEGVLDMLKDHSSSSRSLSLCLEYLCLFRRRHGKLIFAKILSHCENSILTVLLETFAQIRIAQDRENWHSLDPLTSYLQQDDIDEVSNEILQTGTFFTPLALMSL